MIDNKVQVPVQITWQCAFTQKQLKWGKLWKNVYNSYNIGKTNDILFKILHNCLPTKVRLKKNTNNRGNYNSTCKTCNKSDETILHIFARCKHARDIWEKYEYIYKKLNPNTPFIYEETTLTINLQDNTNEKICKLLLTITEIILLELWYSRNNCEKENIQPNLDRSTKTINRNITTIIETHYKNYKEKKDFKTFEEKFAIEKVICQVDYHKKLNLYLPP